MHKNNDSMLIFSIFSYFRCFFAFFMQCTGTISFWLAKLTVPIITLGRITQFYWFFVLKMWRKKQQCECPIFNCIHADFVVRWTTTTILTLYPCCFQDLLMEYLLIFYWLILLRNIQIINYAYFYASRRASV